MKHASYVPMQGGRPLTLVIFVTLCAGGVFLVVKTIQGGPTAPPPLFALAFIVILIWNGYWWLWRTSYRLETDSTELRWMTPLRSGSARIADITTIRPTKLTSQISIIKIRGQQNVMVYTVNGFSDFARFLGHDGEIAVSTGLMERFSRGFGKRSAFEEWV